jgi:hypothetical protein
LANKQLCAEAGSYYFERGLMFLLHHVRVDRLAIWLNAIGRTNLKRLAHIDERNN